MMKHTPYVMAFITALYFIAYFVGAIFYFTLFATDPIAIKHNCAAYNEQTGAFEWRE